MKICYISNARLPTEKAHGIQIMQMGRAFVEAGAEVELVVPARRNAITDDPFAYYGFAPTFTIRRLPAIDLGVGGRFGMLTYGLLQWSFARQALRYARAHAADLFYIRDELVFRTLALGGISCVYEAHTIPRRFSLYRRAFMRAKAIVAISHGLKDALVSLGVPEASIIVAPDGVRLADFAELPDRASTRRSLCVAPDQCLVLYTGQLYAWKGVDTLIDAARELPSSGRVMIVGGGAGRLEELKEKAKGSATAIEFAGQVPYARIPAYLSAADIVAIPNSGKERISREYTSPLKLFEALAAGKAIVASDLPSLREVLNDSCASFVTPDDAGALRAALTSLVEHPDLRESLGSRAKEVAKTYDWTERAKKILSAVQL